jgi:hypothetical protein
MKNNKLIIKLISELEKAPLSSGNFEIGVIGHQYRIGNYLRI